MTSPETSALEKMASRSEGARVLELNGARYSAIRYGGSSTERSGSVRLGSGLPDHHVLVEDPDFDSGEEQTVTILVTSDLPKVFGENDRHMLERLEHLDPLSTPQGENETEAPVGEQLPILSLRFRLDREGNIMGFGTEDGTPPVTVHIYDHTGTTHVSYELDDDGVGIRRDETHMYDPDGNHMGLPAAVISSLGEAGVCPPKIDALATFSYLVEGVHPTTGAELNASQLSRGPLVPPAERIWAGDA